MSAQTGPACRCRRWIGVLGLLAAPAVAEVVPDWSVALESAVLAPGALPAGALGFVGADKGLYLAQSNGGQFVSTLALGPSASVRDQFAVASGVPVTATVEWLDGNDTGALVRFLVSASRMSLHRVDAAGRLLWTLDRRADEARLLDNGDVVVLDEHLLLRLAAEDGRVLWSRNLLDAPDRASSGAFVLGMVVDGQIDIAARYLHEPTVYAERLRSAWLLAVDAADGDIQWAVNAAEGASQRWRPRCLPQVLGATRIDVRFEGHPLVDSAVVERRSRSDGELHWSRRIAATYNEGGACAALAHGGRFYLSIDEGVAPGRLHALDVEDGGVLWQRTLEAGRPEQVHPAPAGNLVLVESGVAPSGSARLLTRRRGSDGALSWSVEVPAAQLAVGGNGVTVSVAWTPAIGTAALAHFQQYHGDTGALLAAAQEEVRAFESQPVVAARVQGMACAALAVDAPQAHVDLQCRLAVGGALAWSQSLPPLAAGERITLLQLLALGTDRLLLRVSTRLAIAGGDSLRDHLYVFGLSDGAPLWKDLQFGLTNLVSGADAGVYLRACAAPPACTAATLVVRALDGLTGTERWSRPTDMTPLAAGSGVLLGWRQSGQARGFQALAAADGADAWLHDSGAASLAPEALVTRSGAVLVKHESVDGGGREVRVLRMDPALGTPIYSLQPSLAAPRTESARLQESADGDLLVSAIRGTGGWLARARVADGQAWWQAYPVGTSTESLTARFAGPLPAAQWAHVSRARALLLRRALARLQPDGNWSAEHVYASEPAQPGELPGAIQLLDVEAAGAALAFDRRRSRHGLLRAVLQGWPAPGTLSGDVRIEIPASPAAAGMSPSVTLELQVTNASPHALDGLVVHADSAVSALWFRLLGCVPAAACTPPSGDQLRLSLPPNGTAQVQVEVIDPGYRPGARWGEDSAVFRVDTPFDFGDVDLGNNLVWIPVRLGGMGDGFE